MGGGLPRSAHADGLLPCPYFSLQQFRIVAVNPILAGQSRERQVKSHAELGPELFRQVGDQDRPRKKGRKLRSGVMKIKIHRAGAEERNRKVERASIHRASNHRLDALRILLYYHPLTAFYSQRAQSLVGIAKHRVPRSMLS